MIQSSLVNYKTFGRCLTLSNGSIEVYVTLDIGPRIIKCNLVGRENLMFNNDEKDIGRDVSSAFGDGEYWYIYGGHRMWVSPECLPLSYYPDNHPVAYELTDNGARFSPEVQKVTGYKYDWELVLADGKPEIDIIHKLTNASAQPVKGAIWCLSVMDTDGLCIIPQPKEDTGLLANRALAIWPYADMSDSRVFWGEMNIGLKQNPAISRKFKLGLTNTAGKLAYINHNQALVKSYVPCHGTAEYPDYGVSSEVFTNMYFLEVESLSPLATLAPGASVTHTEHWTLFDGVEMPTLDNDSLNRTAEKLGL